MKPKYAYYCSICWQEMDDPAKHDSGSYHANQRLNGHCRGDIRRQGNGIPSKRKRGFQDSGGSLNLDRDEPLIFK